MPHATSRRTYKILAITALLTLIADQLSKWLITSRLPGVWSVDIIPGFFNIVHVRNRGAAFGFLNRSDIDWQIWLFAAATVIAVLVILGLLRSTPATGRLLPLGLGLVLGGAVGNLIDRLRFRAVIDFLDFHIGNWHWPAFNIADIGICCGALLACLVLWRTPSAASKSPKRKRHV